MLIEGTSKYYLKRIRAKAKMYEYHIPEKLHGETEKQVNQLVISAISIIGDFSEAVIESFIGKEINFADYQYNLRFAAKFFDGYVDSKLYLGDEKYYLLLGAIVYYLCDYNGSSMVLASRVDDSIDLEVNGLDYVILQILRGKQNIEYSGKYDTLFSIINDFNSFMKLGVFTEYNGLTELRKLIYQIGNDREVLFVDALIAIIYMKIEHSAYKMMPQYTEIEFVKWQNVLEKGTLITELWQSQRELGNNGVFSGKSATIQMPTSSGKTKSIALIILSAFLSKRTNNAIVVAPFRSLCREITDELTNAFSFCESIHVNELSDVLQMDILDVLFENKTQTGEQTVYIVTPEKLLFVLRQNISFLSLFGLIIFDEGHLFDDYSRGITYELLISTIKLYVESDTQKILISAVIPNAEEINGWLTNNEGVVIKNNVIQTTEKAVSIAEIKINQKSRIPYAYLYFLNPENPEEEEFFVPRVITQVKINKYKREKKDRVFPEINNGRNKNKNDMAIAFAINLCINGGTAIFCGRKDTADHILDRILDIKNRGYNIESMMKHSDDDEINKLSKLIGKHLGADTVYFKAAREGAFVHHGGIPMGIRCSVEYAMQKGKICFLACTSTLSQGVNLPIRYLIIPSIYQGKERIKVRDFQNLIGRAGRAGIYTEGNIILSETQVYRYKNNMYENWKWNNYKKLLNSNQAEACTSELLSWIRVDDEMEEYLEGIMDIFENHYATGDFTKHVNSFLEKITFDKEETHKKAEFIVSQMIKNIEAIESFLLFYLMEDTYDESRDTIHDIMKETLAYYLANSGERKRLLHIIDLIGSFIVKSVDTPEKRMRYSKSLLGVRKEIEIEQWVDHHILDIYCCSNDEELLKAIFPLLLNSNNSLVKACNFPEKLLELGIKWISGESYADIHSCAEKNNICIFKRRANNIISLSQVIELCDGFFGYDCTLLIAAIIENVEYNNDDSELKHNMQLLSKRIRYGLANQCAITLYEMGFNDRVIASNLACIIEKYYKVGNRNEIRRLLRKNEDIQKSVLRYIEQFPSYFQDKVEKLVGL